MNTIIYPTTNLKNVESCQKHGLIIRAVAGNSLAFCSLLIITKEEIDEMIEKFSLALDETMDYASAQGILVG